MKDIKKGILFTLLLSCVVLFLFYRPLLKNPNNVYFSPSGDGLKSYIVSIYHLDYDTSLFRNNAMNYPYGEMAFFTDCQPMITNPIKLLNDIGIDFRPYIVGIINMSMLLSIVFAAVFISLIFLELNVSWWFAAIAAIGISMVSPQIGRLGGHFSLSHLMWLPMLIWLLMRFDKKKSYVISGLIGLVTFLAAGMHMYFFALFGFLFLFYWVNCIYTKQIKISDYRWAIHLFIQVILPLILVQYIIGHNNTITDRTTHPWGLTTYRANPASVLLPLGKPYAHFLMNIKAFRNYDWEAYAYIGLVALIGFIAGIFKMVQRVRLKQSWWKVSDNRLITVFFWASVASLLLSFSIPFNLGLMFLLDYLGPIQQLRALARFSWLFYYLINLLVFYGIFCLLKRGMLFKILAMLALVFLLYDGYLNVNTYAQVMNNRVPELEDQLNVSPENEWVNIVKKDDYQAILPLPYFHVGSENVWFEQKCDILRQSFIVTLKTGLPSMGVMLSRTSLSQTYKSLSLVSEPVSAYQIIKDLPNRKPLLLMVENCNDLSSPEKNLVRHSSFVWKGPIFSLYSLPIAQLDTIALIGQKAFESEMLPFRDGTVDTTQVLYFNGFENNKMEGAFAGTGAYTGSIEDWNCLAELKLKNGLPGDTCEILFWAKGYKKDLFARSVLEFIQSVGDKTVDFKFEQLQHHFCSLKDDWMRIKIQFVLKSTNDQVKISVQNKDLKHFQLVVDDLIIRKRP